jgi:hypothetical protein
MEKQANSPKGMMYMYSNNLVVVLQLLAGTRSSASVHNQTMATQKTTLAIRGTTE